MANSKTLHAVIFRIGALICAAPAGIVREILPRLPATRIPGVAQAIEGLVNVRGTLLTVLDGHVLLQQERRVDDEGAIVVVEVAGRRYGLGVGQVLDFLEVPEQSVAAARGPPGRGSPAGARGGPPRRPALHPARHRPVVRADHRCVRRGRPAPHLPSCPEELS